MAEKRTWATSEDGSLEYVSITKDLLQASLEAMQRSFYVHENVCLAFDVPNQPECFPEMDALLLNAAKDGVSIAAVETATGKVVGAAFNKLEEPGQSNFYPEHAKSCKYSGSRGVAKWMSDLGDMYDIFEHYDINSVMEIMFLGIIPEFRKRGIAKKLFEVSIEVGRRLKEKENVKVPIDGKKLERGNPPQIFTGIFTSFVTQKIAKDFQFSLAVKIDFDKFIYDGISLKDMMKNGSSTSYLTYEYLRL